MEQEGPEALAELLEAQVALGQMDLLVALMELHLPEAEEAAGLLLVILEGQVELGR